MDFSIFDSQEHFLPLSWLGKKSWFLYKDLVGERAIMAAPRRLFLKPTPTTNTEHGLVVREKEYSLYPKEMWDRLDYILKILSGDPVGVLWYETLAKSLAFGPKLFRPTLEQCEALQHAEARYSYENYHQPYPVIILEIPSEYKELLKLEYKITESPSHVLVNHNEAEKYISVSAFYSKANIISHIFPDRPEYPTIEDAITRNRERRTNFNYPNPGNIPIISEILDKDQDNWNEFEAAENVQRLGINFAMMMSLYTVKLTSAEDSKDITKWKQEANLRRRGGEFTHRAVEAQSRLASAVKIIEFDQQVSFYDEIEEESEHGQPVDIDRLHKSPRSHWRRGHFVMQPCGIGRRERKMIFRKPVLVRAKYFIGELKDAAVTYTMQNRNNPTVVPASTATEAINPPADFQLKIGDLIKVKTCEEVEPGTVGQVKRISKLGPEIIKILAVQASDEEFAILSPPDEFEIIDKA